MFETTCTLTLSSHFFAQAIHPIEPVITVGLSSGHVQSYRLPSISASDDDDANASVLSAGTGTVDTVWRTRRHKGSCRSLSYSHDGEVLYSTGTDGIIKGASSTTGQVVSKFAIPLISPVDQIDAPCLIHALSPQTLLLATDSSALFVVDLRDAGSFSSNKPAQRYGPHGEYISSLTPLSPTEASTSGYSKQWVTTGGSTLAVTDLRRGVLVKSEDQDEELLSSVLVSGLAAKPGRSTGEKILVGTSSGVLTLWERGVWDDQHERIIVDGGKGGGDSLDALAVAPPNVGGGGKHVVVGLGGGTIRVVKLGPNKIIGEDLKHDDIESVTALGFDVEGRMISGGGSVVKVWQEKMDLSAEQDMESDEDDSEDEQDETKHGHNNDHGDSDDSGEEEQPRKKQKRQKTKTTKHGDSGVLAFKGMD